MVAQMDAANRALCYYYRNPPDNQCKLRFADIALRVRKTDGTHPSVGAVKECVATFHQEKGTRGRKPGWRKTSRAEDGNVLKTFKKARPAGHGVDSRRIHSALPKKLREKVCRRTVIRRLAEKGYTPTKKAAKSDPGPSLAKRRLDFAGEHVRKTPAQWRSYLQAVADIKEFTFYPRDLKPRFKQLRAPWTYMRPEEKFKPAFVRPKRWFRRGEYKKVRKQKIFGMTTSTGKVLAICLPTPFTAAKWAGLIASRVHPFLRQSFPERHRFRVLFDGESVLRAEPAKSVFGSALHPTA